MRSGGGKAKGGGYENDVSEKISLWLSEGVHKKLLCRTVGSGAQFTNYNKQLISAGQAGDLMAQDPLAFDFCSQFVVECKFWKDLEIHNFLFRKGLLYDALLKVQSEAEGLGKMWWLIAKQNHKPDLLFMPINGMKYCFDEVFENVPETLSFHKIFNGQVYMFRLEEFVKEIPSKAYLGKLLRTRE
jgi:hypothetical protein